MSSFSHDETSGSISHHETGTSSFHSTRGPSSHSPTGALGSSSPTSTSSLSSAMSSLTSASASISPAPTHRHNPNPALEDARNRLYPKEVWYFLGGFIALAALLQLASVVFNKAKRIRKTTSTDSERGSSPGGHGISLRRIPLAVLNMYRVIAFRSTINIGSNTLNMAEVALTAMYIVALLTWELINTTSVRGEKFDVNYWSIRAGALVSSQLPLITALGTKNNIIGLLTGVSFEKLNYLHRMTARVIFVLVWIHAGSQITIGLTSDDLSQAYIRLGITAASALTILCIVSIRPVRRNAYEFFFYLHFVLVLIFLIGSYIHVNDQDSYYSTFIWPSFIIWGLDRLMRAIRLVVFNNSFFGQKSGSGTLDAKTELLSEHLVRLTLRRPPHFHWSPGQMAYLIMPSVSKLPFESHPFTIASLDSSSLRGDAPVESSEKTVSEGASPWKDLVFLINIHGGATKRLGSVAASNGTVKVFVDGPYGSSADLSRFETVVLVAGGSGVSYTLPILLDTIERARLGKNNCQKLTFVWAIRDAYHIRWISDTVFQALQRAPDSLNITIQIHVTASNLDNVTWDDDSIHEGSPESSIDANKRRPSIIGLPAVTVYEGRPEVSSILNSAAEQTQGCMSVSVCGSSGITQVVRNALGFPLSGPGKILRGGASISLHVEEFGYA